MAPAMQATIRVSMVASAGDSSHVMKSWPPDIGKSSGMSWANAMPPASISDNVAPAAARATLLRCRVIINPFN